MKKKFPWGGLLFGVAVVGVTGGVLYMASRSSSALDEARRIYRRLSPRERFIGMLYLDGALSDSPAPKNKGPEAGSSLAILAMNLLSEVSPADRAVFAIEQLGGPAGVVAEEKAFTADEVRLMRAALDTAGQPYASPDAAAVIKATNPALAARLGI